MGNPGRQTNIGINCGVMSLTDIGDSSSWSGYIGLVYADGNAMGKIIKALDSPATYRQFSRIVDESIREACFTALNQVCESEINNVGEALKNRKPFESLPADILLLGGDDLLVALPADRALDFALKVTETFQALTQAKIADLEDKKTQEFFCRELGQSRFHDFLRRCDCKKQLPVLSTVGSRRGVVEKRQTERQPLLRILWRMGSHALTFMSWLVLTVMP